MRASHLQFCFQLARGIAQQFGSNCEVVVHDLDSNDVEHSIVAIENGHVSGRRVGDGPSHIVLEALRGDCARLEDRLAYLTRSDDGKILKSSTIYVKDEQGKILGSLCVNCDITDAMIARKFLNNYVGSGEDEKVETTVYNNVDDLLVSLINESIHYVGTPVAVMNREQKIEGIRYLNNKGAFKIKNASTIVSKYYDVSRYTIYNYINDGQNQNDTSE